MALVQAGFASLLADVSPTSQAAFQGKMLSRVGQRQQHHKLTALV
jgi:hypothetical protein